MNFTTIDYNKANIQLSLKDLNIFQNLLREVQLAIPDSFHIRVGISPREARGFLLTIVQDIKQSGKSEIEIIFSSSEIILFSNLLNEACNGIKIIDFEAKIGINKQEAKKLLDLVHQGIHEMDSFLKTKRLSYLPSRLSSYKEIGVKYYSIVADGYQLIFGLTTLPMIVENQLFFKVKLIISSRSNNFELLNNFTLKQLWDLVNKLEKHFDFSETKVNQDSEKSTLILENGTLQIEIQSKITIVSKKIYIIHDLLVTVVNSQTEFMKPFLGVKGTVTFNELSSFTLSMREMLIAYES